MPQATLLGCGFSVDPLLAKLPKCIDRSNCDVQKYGGQRPTIKLRFECCCQVDPVRVTVNVPKSGWAHDGQAAQNLADKAADKHGVCQAGL